MYNLLIKLIVAAALIELGLTLKDIGDCPSRSCLDKLQRASQHVLRIDWKPISVLPEEARKFQR